MNILMICTRVPYPMTAGFRIRIYSEARYFKKAGHTVDILYFGDDTYEKELSEVFENIYPVPIGKPEAALRALWAFLCGKPVQVGLYESARMKRTLKRLIREKKYDAVIGNNIRTAEYLVEAERQTRGQTRIIMDYHDAISYNYHNLVPLEHGIRRIFYRLEEKRVLSYEILCTKTIKKSIMISQNDKDYLAQRGADVSGMEIIPVAVRDDISAVKTDYDNDEQAICFLGKMSYQPNEDAVVWFAENIWSDLSRSYPDLTFYVIGIEPGERVTALAGRWGAGEGKTGGIVVTGFVEDPYTIISRCKAMVVPIRNGAGMQNKVLESMFTGTPVVMSSIAAEGLAGRAGDHFLLADTKEEYIKALEKLLGSSKENGAEKSAAAAAERRRIGENGQKLVQENYTWTALCRRWIESLSDD